MPDQIFDSATLTNLLGNQIFMGLLVSERPVELTRITEERIFRATDTNNISVMTYKYSQSETPNIYISI